MAMVIVHASNWTFSSYASSILMSCYVVLDFIIIYVGNILEILSTIPDEN